VDLFFWFQQLLSHEYISTTLHYLKFVTILEQQKISILEALVKDLVGSQLGLVFSHHRTIVPGHSCYLGGFCLR